MKTQKAFLILAAIAAGTTVYADKVTLNQAPPAVQQAIRSRAALRPIEDIDRDTANGKTTYEASWKDNAGQQQELLVDENGQVVRDVLHGKKGRGRSTAAAAPKSPATANPSANTTVVGFEGGQAAPMNWASETVQNRFRRMANGSNVENFQKGKYNGVTAYEGSFQRNGTNLTMIVGEDGKILVTPRQASAFASAPISSTANGTIPGFENAQAAPMNWASETVQNKFKQMANGANIQNFQKGQYQGRTAYLGSYTQNGQPTTVVLGEDGSLLTSTPTAVGSAPGSVSGSSSSR